MGVTCKVVFVMIYQFKGVWILFVPGCEGYPTNPANPFGGSPDYGDGHPLRLQLSVQAAGDGEGDQQDKGGDGQKQDFSQDR